MCVLDGTNTWSLIRPGHESSVRSTQLIRRWVIFLGGRALLDAKTGLLTVLLAGKQGWKWPVPLLGTCCGSKSLIGILIDPDFRAYLVLNPLVTL